MFQPWVGSKFSDTKNRLDGNRLLILGESHYTEEPEWIGRCEPTDTVSVIRDLALIQRYRFFTTLSKLVSGVSHSDWSDAENEDFWNAIAFYNYIPVYLKKYARPDSATWLSGGGPLSKVIEELAPDTVIVCGIGLWWWVMNSLPGGVTANPPNKDSARIGTGIGIRIPHPTGARGKGRYIFEKSRPLVEQALSKKVL